MGAFVLLLPARTVLEIVRVLGLVRGQSGLPDMLLLLRLAGAVGVCELTAEPADALPEHPLCVPLRGGAAGAGRGQQVLWLQRHRRRLARGRAAGGGQLERQDDRGGHGEHALKAVGSLMRTDVGC